MKKHHKEKAPALVIGSTVFAFAAILLLFGMIAGFAVPVLFDQTPGGPLSWVWNPREAQFGILPMLVSSFMLACSATMLAFPLSVGISFWLLGIARPCLSQSMQNLLRFMTAIPTVVYGFVALFLLTPAVRGALGGSGLCWLSAAIMLTLLILPTMIFVLQAGLANRLSSLCPAGLALGFSKLDLLWLYALPSARKSLIASLVLGFGRAIGDTLLPLMLAGNATQVPGHIWESMRTLTAHMALVTANEVGGTAYNSLFAAGLFLLLVNALVSVGVRRLGGRS